MNHREHLEELRKDYIEANPSQGLHVALQRINNPDHGPNLIVAYVSAIEGFARSLAMYQEGHTKSELSAIYPKYRNMGAEKLIELYLQRKSNSAPHAYFGNEIWEKIGFAIGYRNLLAHECTYLGQDRYPDLIDACKQALKELIKLEGLQEVTL